MTGYTIVRARERPRGLRRRARGCSRRGSPASTSTPSTSVSASFATAGPPQHPGPQAPRAGGGVPRHRRLAGRIKLDDDIVDLKRWDLVRIASAMVRALEAGPDGLRWLRSDPTVPRAATARPSRTGGRTDAMTAGDVVLPRQAVRDRAGRPTRWSWSRSAVALRSYAVGGVDVLDGYAGRGHVHIRPRPGADPVADGSRMGASTSIESAIAGPGRGAESKRDPRARPLGGLDGRGARAARVVMPHVVHPQPGYPWSLSLVIEYSLSDAGLTVRTTATNAGDRDCPYGCGATPP